jgi:uncharacterized membrane protein
VEHNCAWLQSVFLESEAMRDAVLLLKVWFRQRRMQASADYVNGFLLSMLMAHLLTNAGGKRINLHMTALQIFRVIMDAIVTSSTFEKGVFIQTGEVAGPSAEVIIIFSTQLFNPACRKLYFFYLLVFKAASLICVMMLGLWTGSENPFADV